MDWADSRHILLMRDIDVCFRKVNFKYFWVFLKDHFYFYLSYLFKSALLCKFMNLSLFREIFKYTDIDTFEFAVLKERQTKNRINVYCIRTYIKNVLQNTWSRQKWQ